MAMRSHTGMVFLCNGAPVKWLSKKQITTSKASAEAEIYALSTAAQALKTTYYRAQEMGAEAHFPGTLYVDNAAGVSFQQKTNPATRLKGTFDLRAAWVQELQDQDFIKVMMRALALYAYSLDPSEIRKMDNDFSDPKPIQASTHDKIEERLEEWLSNLQDLRALNKIDDGTAGAHAIFTSCERLLSAQPSLHTQLIFFYEQNKTKDTIVQDLVNFVSHQVHQLASKTRARPNTFKPRNPGQDIGKGKGKGKGSNNGNGPQRGPTINGLDARGQGRKGTYSTECG